MEVSEIYFHLWCWLTMMITSAIVHVGGNSLIMKRHKGFTLTISYLTLITVEHYFDRWGFRLFCQRFSLLLTLWFSNEIGCKNTSEGPNPSTHIHAFIQHEALLYVQYFSFLSILKCCVCQNSGWALISK